MNTHARAKRHGMAMIMGSIVMAMAISARAIAEPIDFNRVPITADWVLHMDLETLYKGELGPWLEERMANEPRLAGARTMLRNAIGFDPTTDMVDFTMFGSGRSPEQTVAVATVTADMDKLFAALMTQPRMDFQSARHLEHTVYSWVARSPGRRARVNEAATPARQYLCVFGAEGERRLIVTGRDDAAVRAVLEVLDGRAAAAAGHDRFARPDVGARFYLAVNDLPTLAENGFRVPMTDQARSVVTQFGEHAGEMFIRMRVETAQPAAAISMRDALLGLRTLAHLRTTADGPEEKLPAMINRVDITQHDATVDLHLRVPTAQMGEVLREQWDKPRQR